jgi:hypothetical protein
MVTVVMGQLGHVTTVKWSRVAIVPVDSSVVMLQVESWGYISHVCAAMPHALC